MEVAANISIKGFKSIVKTRVPLGDLTILVGPPSSGKSNILEALALLGYGVKTAIEPALNEYGENGSRDRLSSYIRGITCTDYLNRLHPVTRAEISIGTSSLSLSCSDDPWMTRLVLHIGGGEYFIESELRPPISFLEELRAHVSDSGLEQITELLSIISLLAQREKIAKKPYRVMQVKPITEERIEIIAPRLYGFDRMRAIDNIMMGRTGAFYPRTYLDEKARNIARLLYTREDVLDKINQIIADLCDLTVKPLSDGKLAFFDHGREVGPSSISDTVLRIIYGFSALYLSKTIEKTLETGSTRTTLTLRPLVMLEEPEAHMYPVAFADLASAVTDAVSSGNLVLVTTHSGRLAQILWEEALKRNHKPRVYYVYRDPLKGTTLYEIDMRQLAERLEDLDYIVHEQPGEIKQLLQEKILQPIETTT